jgi:hypothetical protein
VTPATRVLVNVFVNLDLARFDSNVKTAFGVFPTLEDFDAFVV